MEPVKDENGNAKLDKNGFQLWRNGDKEIGYDVGDLIETNSKLTSESAGLRKDIDALTAKLATYDGIDPEKYRTAIEFQANADPEMIRGAGNTKEMEAIIAKRFEAIIADLNKAREVSDSEWAKKLEAKDSSFRNLLVKGAFESSAWLREKTHLDPDTAFNTFGGNVEIEERDGKFTVVGKLGDQPLFSVARPGTRASGDELIELLVGSDPNKPFMRTTPGGSGTQSSTGSSKLGTPSRYTDCKTQEQKRAYLENDRNLAKAAS